MKFNVNGKEVNLSRGLTRSGNYPYVAVNVVKPNGDGYNASYLFLKDSLNWTVYSDGHKEKHHMNNAVHTAYYTAKKVAGILGFAA